MILSITIITSFLIVQGQSDIIYTTNKNIIINWCKITEVRNINMVYYTKNFKSDSVEAVAITKDGNYITLSLDHMNLYNNKLEPGKVASLYKGHDYNYYQQEYKRSS